jgi:hypothetical protein
MGAPSFNLSPDDPLIAQAQQGAQDQLINSLQTQTRSDSASLMAQYGSLASAIGNPGSPSATIAKVA